VHLRAQLEALTSESEDSDAIVERSATGPNKPPPAVWLTQRARSYSTLAPKCQCMRL